MIETAEVDQIQMTVSYTTPSSSTQILPLKLQSFTASASNNSVMLQWMTTEEEYAHITLERSENGSAWKPLHTERLYNHTGIHKYQYEDILSLHLL